MNNSYNYSFLIDNKSQQITQHIAFEKRPSENDTDLMSSINLTENKTNKTLFKHEMLSDV